MNYQLIFSMKLDQAVVEIEDDESNVNFLEFLWGLVFQGIDQVFGKPKNSIRIDRRVIGIDERESNVRFSKLDKSRD